MYDDNYGSKHTTLLNNSTHLDLHLNGVAIETVKEQKLLGITIHSILSWKPHINNVCININRKIVLFKRIVYFLNEDMKKMYYHSYVLPVFDYCSVGFGKNMSCSNKLHKLHARIIFSITSEIAIILQKEQKWLTFSERVRYHIAQLVFIKKGNCQSTSMNDLTSFFINSVYGLRSI